MFLETFLRFEAILEFDRFKNHAYAKKLLQPQYRDHVTALRANGASLAQFQEFTPLWIRENFLNIDVTGAAGKEIVKLLSMTLRSINIVFPIFEHVAKSNADFVAILNSHQGLVVPSNCYKAEDFRDDPAGFRIFKEFNNLLSLMLKRDQA